eukprot:3940487-Rhodomonas_salina.1
MSGTASIGHGMSGTELRYLAIRSAAIIRCYAECGIELRYAATGQVSHTMCRLLHDAMRRAAITRCYAECGIELRYAATGQVSHALFDANPREDREGAGAGLSYSRFR